MKTSQQHVKRTYKLYFKFNGNKRYTFEKEFLGYAIADYYAKKQMNDIYLRDIIVSYKIVETVTCVNKHEDL